MFVHLQHLATALIAQAEAAPEGGGCAQGGGMFAPMIIMMGIFYFMWFVPERKKQKAHQAMLEALKRGDEVITTAGLFGTIADIADKTYTIEIAKNVKIKVLKSAVSRRAEEPTKPAAAKDDKSDGKKSE